MGDSHLMSLQPGTIIGGRYEVVKCLGQGSMGLVYACRDRELSGHLVAAKVLFPEVAQDKVAAARFRNEIFASYGVSHPHVVRAYEYLRDGDMLAYTMEYVGGGDLASRLGHEHERISIPECIRMLAQMCSGVQAIHDAGIIHRDLKPENIMLTTDGQIKIADFGIARTGHGPKLTEHGGVVGTIDYVSPEYMLNSQVDWRSDIYALGILGYEMITGESPFRGDSVYATMTKRLKTDPAPPSSLRTGAPTELDRIILLAMARDPEQRYQSAYEMYSDLVALLPAAEREALQRTVGQRPATQPQSGTGAERVVVNNAPPPSIETAEPNAAESQPRSGRVVIPATSRQGLPNSLPQKRAHPPAGSAVRSTTPPGSSVSAVEETLHKPLKLERILSRRSGASGEWNRQQLVDGARLLKGGIAEDRMRTLSHAVDSRQRSVWFDALLAATMILLGVGFGFAILRVFLPGVLEPSRGSIVKPEIDVRAELGTPESSKEAKKP